MKNIDFLNELNSLAQNRLQSKPSAKLIDLGIFNVEGKNVGVAIYERTRTGSIYEIYAFVEQNEHLVESGHVTLGLVENLYDDDWDENGEVDYLYVKKEFRNNKMPSSKNTGENLHIGSFLLNFAENIIHNGAKFNSVILYRQTYDLEVEDVRTTKNQNFHFYHKHGYQFNDNNKHKINGGLEPYIKHICYGKNIVDVRDMMYGSEKSDKLSLMSRYILHKFEKEKVVNLVMFTPEENKTYVLVEQKGERQGEHVLTCYKDYTKPNSSPHMQKIAGISYFKGSGDPQVENRIFNFKCLTTKDEKLVGNLLLDYCQNRLFSYGTNVVAVDYDIIKKLYGENPDYKLINSSGALIKQINENAKFKRVCPIKFVVEKTKV